MKRRRGSFDLPARRTTTKVTPAPASDGSPQALGRSLRDRPVGCFSVEKPPWEGRSDGICTCERAVTRCRIMAYGSLGRIRYALTVKIPPPPFDLKGRGRTTEGGQPSDKPLSDPDSGARRKEGPTGVASHDWHRSFDPYRIVASWGTPTCGRRPSALPHSTTMAVRP